MAATLPEGTILDERYEIQSVLGEGGFGITYAAINVRLGLRVAVKELFWRGHCQRSTSDNRVVLENDRDTQCFEDQKERFLREARIIRDYSGENSIVKVIDYFDENNTAYIVMEYVTGRSLEERIAADGKMLPLDVFRIFLPIVECLGRLHENGIIHRDISPDNILCQEDGSLKLIDFGAAREFREQEARGLTGISKNNYSPAEQIDKNGKQGPWTDVYSLCATMYYCMTTVPPEDSVQRLFLDDLKSLSELGIEIDGSCESIVMKGLSMDVEKRYPSMKELAESIRAVLPEETAPVKSRKPLIIILAAALCVIAFLVLWIVLQKKEVDPFNGIETEQFLLVASDQLSVSEFTGSQKRIAAELEEWAGPGNYLINTDGNQILITVPADLFEGQTAGAVIGEHFYDICADGRYEFMYELKTNWEDPKSSLLTGEHQITPEEFSEEAIVLDYRIGDYENLSRGQLANMFIDLKERLDILEQPYAFGIREDCPEDICIMLPSRIVNNYLAEAITGDIELIGNHNYISTPLDSDTYEMEIHENVDGSYSIGITSNSDITNDFIDRLNREGETIMYLSAGSSPSFTLAQLPVEEVSFDSEGNVTAAFNQFLWENADSISEDAGCLLDFTVACVNSVELPCDISLQMKNYRNSDGTLFLDTDYHGSVVLRDRPSVQKAMDLAEQVHRDTGYLTYNSDEIIHVYLDLPINDEFPETVSVKVDELMSDWFSDENQTVFINMTDVRKDPECYLYLFNLDIDRYNEVFLQLGMDTSEQLDMVYGRCGQLIIDDPDGKLNPYLEQLDAWYQSLIE